MHVIKLILLPLLFSILSEKTLAQDSTNLMNQLVTESAKNETIYTNATFKYTRIINGQSVENLPKNVLDLRISHRFNPLNSGFYNFFGLDVAVMRLGFDYGITNNFMIGVGHNVFQKTYDGFFKLKILKQSTGEVNMPVTVSFVPTIGYNTLRSEDFYVKPDSGTDVRRVSYVLQLLIAKKFGENFSLQLTPTYVHPDNISFAHITKSIIAFGIAGTHRITKRLSVNAEYYYQLPSDQAPGAHNVLSFGIDLGTGGHVFQLLLSNSIGMTEKSFITETTGQWENGGFQFGFNISRVFQLGQKHKRKSEDLGEK
ncbi:MAG: DUF5777 family beta-barrel protein [Mucilaginibacter sp.]